MVLTPAQHFIRELKVRLGAQGTSLQSVREAARLPEGVELDNPIVIEQLTFQQLEDISKAVGGHFSAHINPQ